MQGAGLHLPVYWGPTSINEQPAPSPGFVVRAACKEGGGTVVMSRSRGQARQHDHLSTKVGSELGDATAILPPNASSLH